MPKRNYRFSSELSLQNQGVFSIWHKQQKGKLFFQKRFASALSSQLEKGVTPMV